MYPSIYNNLVAVGFSLMGKLDIAFTQLEQLMAVPLDNEKLKFSGKIFPFTVRIFNFIIFFFNKIFD